MKNKLYAELHCHTNYSFQEGASSIGDLLVRAEALGYPALAITDHDNLCGAMEFAQTARDLSVRALIGAEVTVQVLGNPVPAPRGGDEVQLFAGNRPQGG